MAFTTEQIAALEAALASGKSEIEFQGRRVRFRSVDELQRVLAQAKAQDITQTPIRQYATYSKSGLE